MVASGAFVGLAVLEAHDLVVVAMRAGRFAAFPAHVYEEVRASLLVRETAHELHDTLEFGGWFWGYLLGFHVSKIHAVFDTSCQNLAKIFRLTLAFPRPYPPWIQRIQ